MVDTNPDCEPKEKIQRRLHVIVAYTTESRGIGVNGTIPWKIDADMARFRELTTKTSKKGAQNCVIMGRVTYLSIPEEFRPLKRRLNIVVTSHPEEIKEAGVIIADSLDQALLNVESFPDIEKVFVIGGQKLYEEAIERQRVGDIVHVTEIDLKINCDRFFPKLDKYQVAWSSANEENGVQYTFLTYEKNSI
jgi:dihydrofolate reductase/thymidylate synthase